MRASHCIPRSLVGRVAAGICIGLAGHVAADAPGAAGERVTVGNGLTLQDQVNIEMGLARSTVFTMPLDVAPGAPLSVQIPFAGGSVRIDAQPYSARAAGYQVLVDTGTRIVAVTPGPVRTLRGAIRGHFGSTVAGGLEETGLHLMIADAAGSRWWLEPIGHRFADAGPDDYVLYAATDILDHGHSCGNDAVKAFKEGQIDMGGGGGQTAGGGSPPCIAELACDADFEYFQDYGSVAAVEARINSVINTVNVQYESQTGLTHALTAIVVRTSSNDPYTATDSFDRLCQFITEWTNNQGGIQRDVAHLFTGVDIDGGVIGRAADIGDTGICVNNGGCSGGTFDTFGSYCLAQSDFNGDFGCATDLTAHELGHLWGAFHCSCPGNTMNPFITCANVFALGSIATITSYAATRACLTGDDCGGGGPTGPENDDCADAIAIANGDHAFSTVLATTDGPTHGSCQFDGQTYEDIWYTYVAPCDGELTVSTCGQANYDTDLVVYDGCNCGNLQLLGCNDDAGGCPGFTSEVVVQVVEGNCYLIRVGGWNQGDEGSGTLTIDGPDPADCQPVTGACCYEDGTCAELTEADCGNTGGTYQGDAVLCSQANCEPAGPVNDDCGDSLPVGIGDTAYSTVGATTDGPPHGTCQFDGQTYEDIWYSYVSDCDGDLTVSTCDQADYDTDLVVYDGCNCADLQLLGCNDDAEGCANFSSEVVVPVVAGNCYLVRVGGWNPGDEGTGTLTLSCAAAPTCPCDYDGNNLVDVNDLLFLLGTWGTPGGDCDGDGDTDVDDLLSLLSDWGPC